ncbi:secondary thiamine-phosphate synthase enzyme YjbQ [[Eubacterium] cellulosolvens]
MHVINVQSKMKVEFIDITDKVRDIVSKEKIVDGMCYLFTPHTTAALTINENADPSVIEDITLALNEFLDSMSYNHMEGNSPAHIKSSLIGCSINIFVENQRLVLGTWQGIFFCEFDGPRNRKVYLRL